MDEESKKLLADIFSALEFSDEEKKAALLYFEKKIASELLRSIKSELSKEYQQFISGEGARVTDPMNPMVIEMKDAIKKLHSKEEYLAKSKKIFKQVFGDYVDYMKQGLSADKAALLEKYSTRPS